VKRYLEVLEKVLFFLFVFFIPTQLGKHFWPEWSYVMGIRVDYLSPTLYFLDLIWLGFFVSKILNSKFEILNNFKISSFAKATEDKQNLKLIKKRKTKKKKKKGIKNIKDVFLQFQRDPPKADTLPRRRTPRNDMVRYLPLIGLVVVNVLMAKSWQVTVYGWFRVFQWIWTIKLIKQEKPKVKKFLKWVIPAWIVLESVLGLAQVVIGGSVGGVFYWLGERRFSYLTLGVAKFSLFREMMVRAYGTFSHPNSMAGFLLVVLLLWGLIRKRDLWWWIVCWIGVMGIVVSGSRTVWMIGLLIILINNPIINLKFKIKISKKEERGILKRVQNDVGRWLVAVGVMMMVLGLIGKGEVLGGWDRESFSKRWELNKHALEMIRDNTWFGVGLGNFLVELPKYQKGSRVFWLQPVHNIPLLLISELGIIGVLICVKMVSVLWGWDNSGRPQGSPLQKFQNDRMNLLLVFVVVLLTGMVDHYWITLSQNWWLVAIVLGTLLRKSKI